MLLGNGMPAIGSTPDPTAAQPPGQGPLSSRISQMLHKKSAPSQPPPMQTNPATAASDPYQQLPDGARSALLQAMMQRGRGSVPAVTGTAIPGTQINDGVTIK